MEAGKEVGLLSASHSAYLAFLGPPERRPAPPYWPGPQPTALQRPLYGVPPSFAAIGCWCPRSLPSLVRAPAIVLEGTLYPLWTPAHLLCVWQPGNSVFFSIVQSLLLSLGHLAGLFSCRPGLEPLSSRPRSRLGRGQLQQDCSPIHASLLCPAFASRATLVAHWCAEESFRAWCPGGP